MILVRMPLLFPWGCAVILVSWLISVGAQDIRWCATGPEQLHVCHLVAHRLNSEKNGRSWACHDVGLYDACALAIEAGRADFALTESFDHPPLTCEGCQDVDWATVLQSVAAGASMDLPVGANSQMPKEVTAEELRVGLVVNTDHCLATPWEFNPSRQREKQQLSLATSSSAPSLNAQGDAFLVLLEPEAVRPDGGGLDWLEGNSLVCRGGTCTSGPAWQEECWSALRLSRRVLLGGALSQAELARGVLAILAIDVFEDLLGESSVWKDTAASPSLSSTSERSPSLLQFLTATFDGSDDDDAEPVALADDGARMALASPQAEIHGRLLVAEAPKQTPQLPPPVIVVTDIPPGPPAPASSPPPTVIQPPVGAPPTGTPPAPPAPVDPPLPQASPPLPVNPPAVAPTTPVVLPPALNPPATTPSAPVDPPVSTPPAPPAPTLTPAPSTTPDPPTAAPPLVDPPPAPLLPPTISPLPQPPATTPSGTPVTPLPPATAPPVAAGPTQAPLPSTPTTPTNAPLPADPPGQPPTGSTPAPGIPPTLPATPSTTPTAPAPSTTVLPPQQQPPLLPPATTPTAPGTPPTSTGAPPAPLAAPGPTAGPTLNPPNLQPGASPIPGQTPYAPAPSTVGLPPSLLPPNPGSPPATTPGAAQPPVLVTAPAPSGGVGDPPTPRAPMPGQPGTPLTSPPEQGTAAPPGQDGAAPPTQEGAAPPDQGAAAPPRGGGGAAPPGQEGGAAPAPTSGVAQPPRTSDPPAGEPPSNGIEPLQSPGGAPVPSTSTGVLNGGQPPAPVVEEEPAAPPLVLPPPPPRPDVCQSCPAGQTLRPTTSCACVLPMIVVLRVRTQFQDLLMNLGVLVDGMMMALVLQDRQVEVWDISVDIVDQGALLVTLWLLPIGEDETELPAATARDIKERLQASDLDLSLWLQREMFGQVEVALVLLPGEVPPPPPPGVRGPGGSGGGGGGGVYGGPGAHSSSSSSPDKGVVAGVASGVGGFALIIGCMAFGFVWWRRRKSQPDKAPPGSTSSRGMAPTEQRSGNVSFPFRLAGLSGSTRTRSAGSGSNLGGGSTVAPSLESVHASTARVFSLRELMRATDNFAEDSLLGQGGFGRVFAGRLDTGEVLAVKVLTGEPDASADKEFVAEVEMLGRLHHRNLVNLLGFCTENDARCLVYELVPNGSLDSHLHGKDRVRQILDWEVRIKIALGSARGLAYLHEDSSPAVIHRDFKASNILLELDNTPKVADFGLAKSTCDGKTHVSTRVMGTFGYVAPEYAMTGQLLVKSDVYSFGVVLLELITGRKPVDMMQPPGAENLVAWARPLLATGDGLERLLDPQLDGAAPADSLARMAAIAHLCVQAEASHRPNMSEVVQALQLVQRDLLSSEDDETSVEDLTIIDGQDAEEWGQQNPYFEAGSHTRGRGDVGRGPPRDIEEGSMSEFSEVAGTSVDHTLSPSSRELRRPSPRRSPGLPLGPTPHVEARRPSPISIKHHYGLGAAQSGEISGEFEY